MLANSEVVVGRFDESSGVLVGLELGDGRFILTRLLIPVLTCDASVAHTKS